MSPIEQRSQGDQLTKSGILEDTASSSINALTKSIKTSPSNVNLLYKRCIAYVNLMSYKEALEDATQCVILDPEFTNGYLFKAVCELQLREPFFASKTLKNVQRLDSNAATFKDLVNILNDSTRLVETIRRIIDYNVYMAANDFVTTLTISEQLLQGTPSCVLFLLMKMTALNQLRHLIPAAIIYSRISSQLKDINHYELNLRAMCFYYLGEIEKAIAYFAFATLLAPDKKHFEELYRISVTVGMKKQFANDAFRFGNNALALQHYTLAISEDCNNHWGNARLYFNRSVVSGKMNFIMGSLQDCSYAIQLNKYYVKAYLRRAKLYSVLKMYAECVQDYEIAYHLEPCEEYLSLWNDAKLKLEGEIETITIS